MSWFLVYPILDISIPYTWLQLFTFVTFIILFNFSIVVDKKSKIWERRLMSDFYVAPVMPGGSEAFESQSPQLLPQQQQKHQPQQPKLMRPIDRFRKAVRTVAANSASGRWRTTICGVYQKWVQPETYSYHKLRILNVWNSWI